MNSKECGSKLSQPNFRQYPRICLEGTRKSKKIPVRTAYLHKFEPETPQIRSHATTTVSTKLYKSGHYLSVLDPEHCRKDTKTLKPYKLMRTFLLSDFLEEPCSATGNTDILWTTPVGTSDWRQTEYQLLSPPTIHTHVCIIHNFLKNIIHMMAMSLCTPSRRIVGAELRLHSFLKYSTRWR